jgi:hypothetical protein
VTDNKNDDTEKKGGAEDATGSGKKERKSAYVLPDEEGDDASSAEVIDLEAKREDGEPVAGPFEGVIGDALRQSLRKFVVDKIVPEGQKKGHVDLNLDVDFLREHGRELISSLVQGVAQAILPEKVAVNLPILAKEVPEKATEGKSDEAGEGKEEEPDVGVSVNFDFISFLKGLIASPAAAPVAKAEETEADDDDEDDKAEDDDDKAEESEEKTEGDEKE